MVHYVSFINLPREQQWVIRSVDLNTLESAVDRCLSEEQTWSLNDLALHGCGDFVASNLRAFERAIGLYGKAKAHAKREETRYAAQRAGSDLVRAVQQMKARVETELQEELLFRIDDQILPPSYFSRRLTVRICYHWRSSPAGEWTHRQTTFAYDHSPIPDYTQPVPMLKPSAAKAASDHQDRLYREWEHLKIQALCSVRDFFRKGGDGSDIPEEFAARPSQYGGGLNNFSCNFWQPS